MLDFYTLVGSRARNMWFRFPLNSLKFPLTRETETNVYFSILYNDRIYSYTKKIWHLAIWQNWYFGQLHPSKIEILLY